MSDCTCTGAMVLLREVYDLLVEIGDPKASKRLTAMDLGELRRMQRHEARGLAARMKQAVDSYDRLDMCSCAKDPILDAARKRLRGL